MTTYRLGYPYLTATVITIHTTYKYEIATNSDTRKYDVFAIVKGTHCNADGSVNAEMLGSYDDENDAKWAAFEHMAEND